MSAPLTVADILDLRAYERVREGFRSAVMARKRVRRVSVGPFLTLLFESVDTVRFQVQEMARVERIATDQGIQDELDIYNRLLPEKGELSATLFIELTTESELREWLPQLVGIERSVGFEIGAGPEGDWVPSQPEATHARALSREETTSAVHYVRFPFSEAQVGRFGSESVALAVRHPAYQARTELREETRGELLSDLEGRTVPLPLD